jgi:amino acid transporter
MPEYYIYGILLIFVLFLRIAKNFKSQFKGFIFKFTFIVAIIIFPNFLLIFSPYAVYDGLRLFLYIIPFISVLLALLIFFLYKNKKFLIYKILFYSLILTKIFFLVSFMQLTPYQYVYLNYFSQHVADNTKQFENDYWGTSTKKLIKKIKNNDSLNAENLKIAFCGLSEDEQIKNIKLFTNLKLKFVDKNSEYDFIIMNNRAVWDDLSDNKKTCFEKFKGTDIETISRRGLILSKLTKKYN